jgi:nitrate/TMAO reductase-like tetraheme cytochrome c subunit
MGIRNYIRRKKGILLTLCIVGVVGYIFANLAAYSLTYKSEACLTCHIMKPYYENWKSSNHNKVGCIDCHPYRPSTIVMSTVRYLSGTYKLPLKSRVEDKECIMCHKPETIKVVDFKGMPFNHLEHIKKEKRGKELHCTTCHYSIVQSTTHVDVDKDVCTLCHFYNAPPQYNRNCTVCHGQTRKEVKIGEVNFSHESFLKTGARCIECHSQTVAGKGDTPQERCRECHAERKAEGRDAARLHKIHISQNYIKCFSCHGKMEHGKETTHFSQSINLSCGECHTSTHNPAQDMYMGIGSETVKDMQSAMYVSRVSCTGCHTIEKSIRGKNILSRSWESKKKSCVLCHKPGYDKMAEDWKKNMAIFTEALTRVVDEYGKTLEQQKGSPGLITQRQNMESDLRLLKDGGGAHNIRYAFMIGQGIVSSIQQGYKTMGVAQKPNLPEAIKRADGLCMFCHSTYQPEKELRIKTLNNVKFNHSQHVAMDMPCTKCHDPAMHRLGGFNKKACAECHEVDKFKTP